jgi:hypothetical protein
VSVCADSWLVSRVGSAHVPPWRRPGLFLEILLVHGGLLGDIYALFGWA